MTKSQGESSVEERGPDSGHISEGNILLRNPWAEPWGAQGSEHDQG